MTTTQHTRHTIGADLGEALNMLRKQYKCGYISGKAYEKYLEAIGGDSAYSPQGKWRARRIVKMMINGHKLPESLYKI